MIYIGNIFTSESGREWRVIRIVDSSHYIFASYAIMQPLGDDTDKFGGVKRRRVELHRLENESHGWKKIYNYEG